VARRVMRRVVGALGPCDGSFGGFAMRTLRTILVIPVILLLVAGLAAPIGAQSEQPVPATATGTLEFVEPGAEATVGETEGAMTHEEEALHVHQWTASDPRLTGTATYTGSWHIYDPPSEDCGDPDVDPGAVYEIMNDGGGWRCSGVRAPIPGPTGAANVHSLVLTGTGGYEGLYAYILIDWSASPFAFSALITEDAVPIVPLLPA
jgi:hypothetical protein